jgi:hypothetical protein
VHERFVGGPGGGLSSLQAGLELAEIPRVAGAGQEGAEGGRFGGGVGAVFQGDLEELGQVLLQAPRVLQGGERFGRGQAAESSQGLGGVRVQGSALICRVWSGVGELQVLRRELDVD